MRVYYAHCMSIYNTLQEERDVETLHKLGFEVVNPNDPTSEDKYKRLGIIYFTELAKGCDALAFRALLTGAIGAGISAEIEAVRAAGIPVFELPTGIKKRAISVENTREYLHESGQR